MYRNYTSSVYAGQGYTYSKEGTLINQGIDLKGNTNLATNKTQEKLGQSYHYQPQVASPQTNKLKYSTATVINDRTAVIGDNKYSFSQNKSSQNSDIRSQFGNKIDRDKKPYNTQFKRSIYISKEPDQVIDNYKVVIDENYKKEADPSLLQRANLFSQFKLRYDQLKANYDKLRNSYDEIVRQKKKLQIKLLSSNPEYYEKQIKRLRAQLQKYQQQNQDHRHKYLQAENNKKQLQASLKVKQEELRNYIKNLEKQKISNVELKHQIQEKERVFSRIRAEFERSTNEGMKNYDEANSRANKFQGAYKTKNSENEQLKHSLQRCERKLVQSRDEFKKYQQINEEKIKNMTRNNQAKVSDLQKSKIQLKQKISQLQLSNQKYESERVSADLLKQRKSAEVAYVRQTRQLELDIVRLQQRIRFLEFELVKKDGIIVQLQRTIEKLRSQEQINDALNKINELEQQKLEAQSKYTKTQSELIRQIERLKVQLMKAPQLIQQKNIGNNFQEILKVQLDENARLKKQLSLKIDQVYNLKSDIEELKIHKQNTISELQVLKKVKKAQQKNSKLQQEVTAQYLKGDLQSYRRKIQLLQTKLALKTKQVKDKDSFIMNSVLGRSRQQDVPLILSDFQRIFEANYMEKLTEANKRIQDLSKNKT